MSKVLSDFLYYEEANPSIKIYCGDCLEIMPLLPKVDLVVTDPPYGTTECEWDTDLDFNKFWEALKPIEVNIKVLMGTQPFTTDLIMSNRKEFRYELIWDKGRTSEPQLSNIRPGKCHENILVFYEQFITYNPQKTKLINPDFRGNNSCYGGEHKLIKSYKNKDRNYTDRFPLSIQNFTRENGYHATQKPVNLFKWLINTYSNPLSQVLDPFLGSGTTLIACKELKRSGIGIEIEPKYAEIAVKRLKNTQVPFL